MRFKHFLIFLLVLGWLSQAVFANDLPFAPFEARYKVYAYGLPVGTAVMALEHEGNNGYRMRSDVSPNGLASLFVSEQISERVNGEFRDGGIYPLQYEQQRQSSKKPVNVHLSFDWQNATLQAQDNEKQRTLPLSDRVVDPLSMHLLAMWDLRQGHTPKQYNMVDKTKIKTYEVTRHGEETLDTPLGKFRTIRVSQRRPKKNRVTTFWFAPELEYLTVQIAREKDGKEVLRMVVEEIQGSGF